MHFILIQLSQEESIYDVQFHFCCLSRCERNTSELRIDVIQHFCYKKFLLSLFLVSLLMLSNHNVWKLTINYFVYYTEVMHQRLINAVHSIYLYCDGVFEYKECMRPLGVAWQPDLALRIRNITQGQCSHISNE